MALEAFRAGQQDTSDDNPLVYVQAGAELEHDVHLVPPATVLAYPKGEHTLPCVLAARCRTGATNRGMSRYADLTALRAQTVTGTTDGTISLTDGRYRQYTTRFSFAVAPPAA